jgi:hypothetical protein
MMMTHSEYLAHLDAYFDAHATDPLLTQAQTAFDRELLILTALDLTPAETFLRSLYSPVVRRPHRDPLCVLRVLLLMLLRGESRITEWINTLRGTPMLAVLTGFEPDDVPGVGTIYDFLARIVNGPYQTPCDHVTRPADALKKRHIRFLNDKTEDRHEYPPIYHSQSEALAADLLAHADDPRPDTLQTWMETLLVDLGVVPSIEAGLIPTMEALTFSGDGSGLKTASSPRGKAVCDCSVEDRQAGRCPHPRAYTSETAQFYYDSAIKATVFGDRYYHLGVHLNHHDLPLLSVMGIGSEADATLSLTAVDHLLKVNRERGLNLDLRVFAGDKHHDTYAHYEYFAQKQILTAIPLRADAKDGDIPHLTGHPDVKLASDGCPLCPGGCPMRRHGFHTGKQTHTFCCPAKRLTHRKGKAVYIFHPEDCPRKQDCCPESRLGPFAYLKSSDDPRFYPPIARDSKRFKTAYAERTTTERLNAVNDAYKLDRCSRNASYAFIRLTLANILEHAVVRFEECVKRVGSRMQALRQALTRIAASRDPVPVTG